MTNHWDYGYDVLGQLTSAKGFESSGASRAQEQLTYGYDLAGNLQSRTNNDMVQSFSVNSLYPVRYGTDFEPGRLGTPAGQRTLPTGGRPLSHGVNQLTSVSRTGGFTVAGATTPSATNVTVKANGAGGQVATLYADKTFVRTNVSLLSGNNTFSAEAADALGRKDTNAVTVNLPASLSYTYDSPGEIVAAGPLGATVSPLAFRWGGRVRVVAAIPRGKNGNLTSDGYRAFTYDDVDQLTAVQVANVWRSDFVYDAFGRRRIRREKVWKNSQWGVAAEVRYVYA
jgi:YD repeat-containing protein